MSTVSGPVPTELVLEVLFLKKHHQVTVLWVVPSVIFPQDVCLEPPRERGSGPWKRDLVISPG